MTKLTEKPHMNVKKLFLSQKKRMYKIPNPFKNLTLKKLIVKNEFHLQHAIKELFRDYQTSIRRLFRRDFLKLNKTSF